VDGVELDRAKTKVQGVVDGDVLTTALKYDDDDDGLAGGRVDSPEILRTWISTCRNFKQFSLLFLFNLIQPMN